MELINQNSVSVYLDVPLKKLLDRLTNNEIAVRPLFTGLDTAQIILKLKDMHLQRSLFYEKAKIKLRGEENSPELLIAKWIHFLEIKP
jgi:shikimate kinase